MFGQTWTISFGKGINTFSKSLWTSLCPQAVPPVLIAVWIAPFHSLCAQEDGQRFLSTTGGWTFGTPEGTNGCSDYFLEQ